MLGQRIWMGADVVWMAPLADAILFTALAGLLIAAGRFWPTSVRTSVVLTVLLFAALLGPALGAQRLHPIATVLLALGVAVRVALWVAPHEDRMLALVRRTLPILAVVVVLAGLVTALGRAWRERSALAGLAAADSAAPNVLVIILDAVRAGSLSLYGYERETTPFLERLARRGIVFEHALAPSPWTLPSHASFFTGRYPHELTADWETPLDGADPTLAERFAERGYRTAGFVGNLIYATYETGLQRGFAHYEDYPVSTAMIASSSLLGRAFVRRLRVAIGPEFMLTRKRADEIVDALLAWEARGEERPFFAFLNLMDAHAPYLPPAEFRGRFGPVRTGPALSDLSARRDWTQPEIEAERSAYEAQIAFMDREIERLLGALAERGRLENTLVVIASDHGEQFGEHDLFDHGNSLYRPLIEVPLLFVMDGQVPANARVATPVTLRDLATTIADLALDSDAFPGRSLRLEWVADRDSTAPAVPASLRLASVSQGIREPEWLPHSKGDLWSLLAGGYRYIRNGDGTEELYDFAADPEESFDLSSSPALQDVLAGLRESVETLRR